MAESNGHAHSSLDPVVIKGVVDTLKNHMEERLAQHQGGGPITNLGPTYRTEVMFPGDKLAKIISSELAKALGAITWPQAVVKTEHQVVEVNNEMVAKALTHLAKMIESTPLPIVEAVDTSPMREVAEAVRDGNQLILKAVEDQTKVLKSLASAVSELAKSNAKPANLTISHSDGTQSTINTQ